MAWKKTIEEFKTRMMTDHFILEKVQEQEVDSPPKMYPVAYIYFARNVHASAAAQRKTFREDWLVGLDQFVFKRL